MQIYKYAEKHGLETKELLKRLKNNGFEKATPLSKMTDEMIKIVEVDAKMKEALDTVPTINGTKYYYAKSERLTFGGYKPERRLEGYIYPDESIQFENHVYITDDPAKQVFIEATDRFKFNDVKLISFEEYNRVMKELASRRTRMIEQDARTAGRVG